MATQTLWPNAINGVSLSGLVAEDGVTPITSAGISITLAADGSMPGYYADMRAQSLLMTFDPLGLSGDPVIVPAVTRVSVALVKSASPLQFGALGDGSQSLIAVDSYTSDATHTQQTVDGDAINRAIRYLRSAGGGTLHIPSGTYRVYGYLETIDFSLRVVGDGPGVTVIKNCDASPTNTNGYGVFRTGPTLVTSFSTALTDVVFENLTIDGNGDARSAPLERRTSPLGIYGAPRLRLSNVEVLNGPQDALYVNYESPDLYSAGHAWSAGASLTAINCRFSRAFRNALSVISGNNQQYTNCTIEYGGAIAGGTAPKAACDLEPNSHTDLLRDVTFTNCTFKSAGVNLNLSVSWTGNARFVGCTLVQEDLTSTSASWRWVTGCSEVTFDACKFRCTGIAAKAYFWMPQIDTAGSFTGALFEQTQYTRFSGCEFESVGFFGQGKSCSIESTTFKNSACPVVFEQSSTAINDIRLRGVKLTNVIDVANFGSGSTSAFAIKASVTAKRIEIDGLTVSFDSAKLPAVTTDLSPGAYAAYGALIIPTLAASGAYKISNLHVEGFYRKLPTFFGKTLNTSNFRDWCQTVSPSDITCPADTSGVTTTAGSIYWKNCTMYGDAA